MSKSRLAQTIGKRRYLEFKQGLPAHHRPYTLEVFIFDLELRALIMKIVSLIEIALQNQILAVSKPKRFDSFGHARRVLQELPTNKQFTIAQRFGCPNGKELRALLRVLNDARNRAAHHERVWNCKLDFCLPNSFQNRLENIPNFEIRSYSIAGAFVASIELLRNFPEIIQIHEELDNLFAEVPIDRDFLLKNMGFEVP